MYPGNYYHIYNRGINKQLIFFEEENYYYFLRLFKKYVSEFVDVFAYCLMPNHFHFFIRVKEIPFFTKPEEGLSIVEKSFRDFFISYSKSINKKYQRTGALFQYRFKRKVVNDLSYYTWLIFYIHHNPIKSNVCNSFEGWKYSSYNAIVNKQETNILRTEIIKWFGDLQSFQDFHTQNRNGYLTNLTFLKQFEL